MKQCEVFGQAQWVAAGSYASRDLSRPDPDGVPHFPVLRRTFTADGVIKATLRILGLGFFHSYINGREISDDRFLPLSTDYEERDNWPADEKLTGHRTYVPEFDVTGLLRSGSNALVIWFGGGWYTFEPEWYGHPKAIYCLTLTDRSGTREIVSSPEDRIGDSPVKTYDFTTFEAWDARGFDWASFGVDYDDSSWSHAVIADAPDTDYLFSDCPPDRKEKELTPVRIGEKDGVRTYDAGINSTGYPVLLVNAPAGETVEVYMGEERCPDGSLNMEYNYGQKFTYVSDGIPREVHPHFTWFGFRYFAVKGPAEAVRVDILRSAVKVTSTFDSDNSTLNWLYQAYINTQLNNMHAGIPSDCPHIERRGYTGDGELTCHAVMNTMDAEAFYRKWIADIGDCQDIYSGHVQYTAPYTRCGGGPGAWGCAIVEVPYRFYKHYGDKTPLIRHYSQMLRYFDYLESHSKNGLVVSDKPGEWCLGDWCPPDDVALPAPFVNNYYYVKSLLQVREIAALIGRECDIPELDRRIAARKEAITAAYFNTWDSNFIAGLQGANAFALDIGLGDKRTYENMVKYYTRLGRYDTGICGTDIVTRVLFEHGDGDLACRLMASTETISFDGMRQAGSTTLWENWPNAVMERSHDHPMFGAVAAYLFDWLLGIRQPDTSAGYRELVIEPAVIADLNRVSGSRGLPAGIIDISYEKSGSTVKARITVPAGVSACFRHDSFERKLSEGSNEFSFTI